MANVEKTEFNLAEPSGPTGGTPALVGGVVTIVLTRLLNRAGVGIDHRAAGRA